MSYPLYKFEEDGIQNVTAVITTSGTFTMQHPTIAPGSYGLNVNQGKFQIRPAEISNPMFIEPVPHQVIANAQGLTTEIQREFKNAHYYSPADLAGYAGQLVEIGKKLAVNPIDLMIVPYRGGLAPSLQLGVINKLGYPRLRIGFSQGSKPEHWQAICDELVSNLEQYKDRPSLKMAVIDTAIRGDSSVGMAQSLLLAKVHFPKQHWLVTFHLLHGSDQYYVPERAFGIRGLSRSDLIFDLDLNEVPNLLIEDWDAGLGIKADWKEGTCIYRPTSFGQMIVSLPDSSVVVVESPQINVYYNSIVSQFVTENMITDPFLSLKPPTDSEWYKL